MRLSELEKYSFDELFTLKALLEEWLQGSSDRTYQLSGLMGFDGWNVVVRYDAKEKLVQLTEEEKYRKESKYRYKKQGISYDAQSVLSYLKEKDY